MLKANKKVWFEKLFAVYNRNLLKRRFKSLRVKNAAGLKSRDVNIPLIIYANHSSWWDGLVLFEILKFSEFDSYVMMEEKQLVGLKFFRLLGAFSVVRENYREAFESIDYAAGILKSGRRKTLLIFPQGEILPNDFRPLKFYNGFSHIVSKTGKCYSVPCSIRFEFLSDYKPEIFLRFGEVELVDAGENFNKKAFTKAAELKMLENLETLRSDITGRNLDDYQRFF